MAQLLNKRLKAQRTNAVGFLGGSGCLLCVIVHAYATLSLPRSSFFPSDAVIMNANASRQEC